MSRIRRNPNKQLMWKTPPRVNKQCKKVFRLQRRHNGVTMESTVVTCVI